MTEFILSHHRHHLSSSIPVLLLLGPAFSFLATAPSCLLGYGCDDNNTEHPTIAATNLTRVHLPSSYNNNYGHTTSVQSHPLHNAFLHPRESQPWTIASSSSAAPLSSPRRESRPTTAPMEDHNSDDDDDAGDRLFVVQPPIRRQEIVKALQSQPQRGRKRANLNAVERIELTRTRNREHAKSTRVRKKPDMKNCCSVNKSSNTINNVMRWIHLENNV